MGVVWVVFKWDSQGTASTTFIFLKKSKIIWSFFFPLNIIISQWENFKICSTEIFKDINFLVLEIKFYSFLTMPQLLSQLKPGSVLQVLMTTWNLWETSTYSVLKTKQ